ncbi:hypothetical protein NLJ89_g732 [Agrocybe chaxingu]|uniref:Zn(2)-C6 fungal-type domain-containing protein n=1 Tax=Agrocybe chaxingu TaxID=84603 RepID=A0A9W8N1A8_9AGAR|nr:hypothetical protein NLJ89_g732 [Agrocybe chaxingu]
MKADPTKKVQGNPRGRGTYNTACDVCARKKTKCDGNKPVCQPCRLQGRASECAWTKNPVRKPRTEQHFEAMYKRTENLRKLVIEYRRYTDYLESLMDQCHGDQHPHRNTDFRSSRPVDLDNIVGAEPDSLDDDFDISIGNENDGHSEFANDPTKEICLPTQSLKIEEGGQVIHHYGNPSPFRFNPNEQLTAPSRFPALAENPDATYSPLDRQSHDKALDLLFKFFTSWCFRIVPPLFLRDMYRALSTPRGDPAPKTPHYSPMLHNALVALALAFLDDPQFRDLKARQYFANTAKSFIEAECQKPNLSVVHALSILASFHSSQGDQTLGYMYFGMSARMSQALGLNVDCADWVKLGLIEEPDRLDRHWTSWTTFTQDVCWSLYVGRDFCVAAPDSDLAMPVVEPTYDEMPWAHPPSGIPPQPGHLTKNFEATCELLLIARRIMDVVNGLNKARTRPFVIDELISDIDLKLNTWKGALSPELEITVKSRPTATPHKLMLHLAYWWLFILLHRPFFHRKSRPIYSTDREIDHVKLCRRAAENIMELLATWRNLYTLRYCPITLIQTVFSAGTVYVLSAMHATSGVRVAQKELQHSMSQQNVVMQYLQEIGKSWQCATNIAGILNNLMHEQLKPMLERTKAIQGTLQVPDMDGNDEDSEEPRPSLSRSSSLTKSMNRNRSTFPKVNKQRCLSSHSRSQSLSNASSITSGTQVSTSPTITISPVRERNESSAHVRAASSSTLPIPSSPSSFHAISSSTLPLPSSPSSLRALSSSPSSTAPIAIQMPHKPPSNASFSSSPSSWGVASSFPAGSPSPSSSPVFSPPNYPPPSPSASSTTSFVHRGFTGYPQPFQHPSASSFVDDSASVLPIFSGNGHRHTGSGHLFQGKGQLLGHGLNPSQGSASPSSPSFLSLTRSSDLAAMKTSSGPLSPSKELAGFMGMLGGQTLPQAPFFGPLSLGDSAAPMTAAPFDNYLSGPAGSDLFTGEFFGNGYISAVDGEVAMVDSMDMSTDDSTISSWDQYLNSQELIS